MEAKTRLWKAFLSLLEKQFADDISVAQICRAADCHRSTFYRHFHDIFDLLDFGIGYQLSHQHPDNLLQEQWVGLDFIRSHRTALQHLFTVKYHHRFQQAIYQAFEKQILQLFQSPSHHYHNAIDPTWMAHFYVGGIMRAIFSWLQQPSHHEADMQQLQYQCSLFKQQIMQSCLQAVLSPKA